MRPSIRRVLLTFALSAALAALCAPWHASAQQSLFNVPSTVRSRTGEVFAQEQINLESAVESNTTLDIGVFEFAEVGINLLHLGTSTVPTLNGSFVLTFGPNVSWQAGGQFGVGLRAMVADERPLGRTGPAQPTSADPLYAYGWSSLRFATTDQHAALIVGGYLGSSAALGGSSLGGAMIGTEIAIVPERISLIADWLIGMDTTDVAVIGVAAWLSDWQVSMGLQLPSPGTSNDTGLVLEITRTTEGTHETEHSEDEPAEAEGPKS